jgi:phosphatidylglycerophosphatase A
VSRDVRFEARVLLRHPFGLIACGFGSGLSPWASGTTGSAAAVALYWLADAWTWPIGWMIALIVAVFAIGVPASSWACRALATDDAAPIVIDEWVGQWLTLAIGALTWPFALHPWSWLGFLVCGFLLFRVADILKPWPASTLDRDLGGGLGAMADDAAAAVYSALALAAIGYGLSL